jgi:hypothetical protein
MFARDESVRPAPGHSADVPHRPLPWVHGCGSSVPVVRDLALAIRTAAQAHETRPQVNR